MNTSDPTILMVGYFPAEGAVAELFTTFAESLAARVPVATLAPSHCDPVAGTTADFRFPYTSRRPWGAIYGPGWAAHRAAARLGFEVTLLFTQHPLNMFAVPFFRRSRLAFWWHEPSARGQASPLRRLAYAANDLVVAPRSSRIIVASPSVARAVPPKYRDRVVVVPFPSPADFERSSDRFNDCPTDLVFFGKLEPYKGLDTLARALQLLEDRGERPTLRIVGPGRLETAAPLLARFTRDHPDRVFVHNEYVPAGDVASALQVASVCVLPYLTAAGSSAIAVAGHHDVALVASTAGSFGDFLSDGVDARLHEPGDVGALADDLSAVLSDHGLRRRLSASLRTTRSETFSRAATTDQLLRALAPSDRPGAGG